jgi:hypothetical protein
LFSRVQQPHRRDDDHERVTRARQAAEALFTPKREITKQSVSDARPAAPSARKPRVLAISPAAARCDPVEAPLSSPQRRQVASEIPASESARIRTWVKYGMRVSQVAQLYGVAVDQVERVLRQA